jgi:hypothetical protein
MRMRARPAGALAAVLVAAMTLLPPGGTARAQTEEDTPLYGESVWESSTAKEPEAWKEGDLKLPEIPDDDDLKQLNLEVPGATFGYYIAPGSLSLGKDGVVRYVIVLKSASGVSNTLYEGMWCKTKQYKTYAYALDGEFHAYPNPAWQPALGLGAGAAYHDPLYRSYFCGTFGQPNTLKEIRQRIRGVNLGEESGQDHGAGQFFGW